MVKLNIQSTYLQCVHAGYVNMQLGQHSDTTALSYREQCLYKSKVCTYVHTTASNPLDYNIVNQPVVVGKQ